MTTIQPVGVDAPIANQLSCLAIYSDLMATPITDTKHIGVVYTYDTPILNNETVFVPITATITIRSRIFTERIMAAFQEQSALPERVVITSVGRIITTSDAYHGNMQEFSIYDSIEIFIA